MGLKVTNNAFGTLNAGITNSDTTVVLQAGQGSRFPSLSGGDYFYATLIDTSNNLEIVKVTARSTDTMTIVRAQDNTTARAYATNDRFELRPTAAMLNEVITKADTAQATADAALPKAGGTMTGQLIVEASNGAVTVRGASTGAQLKLERTSSSQGHGYLGADADYALRVYNSSFVDGLRVDQSGRVTMPYQPAFLAHKTDSQNLLLNDIITFTSVQLNTGGHYSTSTSRFTAPVAGNYMVGFSVGANSISGDYFYVGLFKNGTTFNHALNGNGCMGNYLTIHHSVIVPMAAGDYLYVRQDSSLSAGAYRKTFQNGSEEQTNFWAYLIG